MVDSDWRLLFGYDYLVKQCIHNVFVLTIILPCWMLLCETYYSTSELQDKEKDKTQNFMNQLGIDFSKGPIKIQPR